MLPGTPNSGGRKSKEISARADRICSASEDAVDGYIERPKIAPIRRSRSQQYINLNQYGGTGWALVPFSDGLTSRAAPRPLSGQLSFFPDATANFHMLHQSWQLTITRPRLFRRFRRIARFALKSARGIVRLGRSKASSFRRKLLAEMPARPWGCAANAVDYLQLS